MCDTQRLILNYRAHHDGAGVVGVAATGWMVEGAGEGLVGWYQAFTTAALLCCGSSFFFLAFASGDRIFGETDQF